MVIFVIRGKKIDGMTIEPLFLTAVPSPPGIGVRIAPVAFTSPDSFFQAFTVLDAIRGRGDRKVGAITSGSNGIGINQTKFHGRDNGSQDKDFLKEFIKTLFKGSPGKKETDYLLHGTGRF